MILRNIDLLNLSAVNSYQKDFGFGSFIDLTVNPYLTVIQHPVTTEYDDNLVNVAETIKALDHLQMPTVWVMPNMDAGADGINKAIRQYRDRQKSYPVHFFKSLPIEIYGPLLNNTICLVGNSSSGIRESAFLGTPTVNIGSRQNGRQRAENVIDVPYDYSDIITAVQTQINHGKYAPSYIYGDGNAALKIFKALSSSSLCVQKTITY